LLAFALALALALALAIAIAFAFAFALALAFALAFAFHHGNPCTENQSMLQALWKAGSISFRTFDLRLVKVISER